MSLQPDPWRSIEFQQPFYSALPCDDETCSGNMTRLGDEASGLWWQCDICHMVEGF